MQALHIFFDAASALGQEDFHLSLKKLEGGSFKFRITSMTGKKIDFILTKSGLTPMDNRGLLGTEEF